MGRRRSPSLDALAIDPGLARSLTSDPAKYKAAAVVTIIAASLDKRSDDQANAWLRRQLEGLGKETH